MCGRYALALRPSQVRQMLQDADMDVYNLPPDEGPHSPRQSFNFAPGYHGLVYRADVPDWGAGPRREHSSKKAKATTTADTEAGADEAAVPSTQASQADDTEATETTVPYKLQSMKWGLIPFWTKRNPDYSSMLKTINCRDDSLATPGGMWASMKGRKRCIVIAQGFFEWLKPGGPGSKEKVPHYVRRADGQLMCFAGLWDCVIYDEDRGEAEEQGADEDARKHYTYTIITTDSNAQLKFLHDRMPVILEPGSEAIRTWLDPKRYEWSKELQSLLKPFKGELEVYPVSKEVGKVGNNSPSFIIPVASKENKSNIANFFANAASGAKGKGSKAKASAAISSEKVKPEVEVKQETPTELSQTEAKMTTESLDEALSKADDGGMDTKPTAAGIKREADTSPTPRKSERPTKKVAMSPASSPVKSKLAAGRGKISATSNGTKSPSKTKTDGSQKITKFFANCA